MQIKFKTEQDLKKGKNIIRDINPVCSSKMKINDEELFLKLLLVNKQKNQLPNLQLNKIWKHSITG